MSKYYPDLALSFTAGVIAFVVSTEIFLSESNLSGNTFIICLGIMVVVTALTFVAMIKIK